MTAYGLKNNALAKQMIVEVFVKPGAQVRYASVHHMAENVIDLTISSCSY